MKSRRDAGNATAKPRIRKAGHDDAACFVELVEALAEYEKLEPPDAASKLRLIEDTFGPSPRIEVFLAECEGVTAGYAIVFETYSSFLALPTLYLEDIFVLPAFRRRRIGNALMAAMAELAVTRGCGRMEWTVLNWNQPALDFYEKLGARSMDEWRQYRLTRDQLADITTRGRE